MTDSRRRVSRVPVPSSSWVADTPSFTAHRENHSKKSSDYPTHGVRFITFGTAELANAGNRGVARSGTPIDMRSFLGQQPSGG